MNLHNLTFNLLSRRYVSCFGNFFYNPVGAVGAFMHPFMIIMVVRLKRNFPYSFTEPQSLLHDEEEEIVDLLRKHMEMGDAEAIYSI